MLRKSDTGLPKTQGNLQRRVNLKEMNELLNAAMGLENKEGLDIPQAQVWDKAQSTIVG